jgi:hypothetical protein
MRAFLATILLLAVNVVSAATLQVEVNRNGFTGPIEIALAPREEGNLPEWSETKTLIPGKSILNFPDLPSGLYTVLARGPQPLQRLSAKANVGTEGNTLRLVIPKTKTSLRVTLAGQPIARASVAFTHDELRWDTTLTTGEDGRFAGPLWEPGLYSARVRSELASGPHVVDVNLTGEPVAIDVPDRHIAGRVIDEEGKPIGGATVGLRTESPGKTLTVRTLSAPDGAFAFFGVPEGAHSLSARAASYLISDAEAFELRGPSAIRTVELKLSRGTQRAVRVVHERGGAIANATLFTACDGHVKSTTVTNAEGRSDVAIPDRGSCSIYALPKEGSIGVARVTGAENLVIRVPDGSSSLQLALTSDKGDAFGDLRLLMRIDGMVVPPAVARQMGSRGFSLITNAEGKVSLAHIPAGTYEFWPYRTEAEGQMIYDMAGDFAAPISVNVLNGENDATVKFKARR